MIFPWNEKNERRRKENRSARTSWLFSKNKKLIKISFSLTVPLFGNLSSDETVDVGESRFDSIDASL